MIDVGALRASRASSAACRSGPCPITSTVSPGATRALRTAFRQVFTGSTNVASSNVTSGGKRNHSALDDPRHRANVLGEAAAVRIEAGGQPDFLVARALREELALAIEAVAARNVMKADDAVAGLELRDAAADLDDRAGEFVAQNLRRMQESRDEFS